MTLGSRLVRLDLRGEVCPAPLLQAAEAMKTAGSEECIELLTDHRPALLTIPAYAIGLDWDVRIQRVGPSQWTVVLSRSGAPNE